MTPVTILPPRQQPAPPPTGGTVTCWQQLGAFVYTGTNLTKAQLNKFQSVGGAWLTIVIYNDALVQNSNRNIIPTLRTWCNSFNPPLKIFGWYNGRGGAPAADATAIANLHNQYKLDGVILDLEAEYQYPQGDANLMPALLRNLRLKLPNADIGVSTNGMNSSMIYNGRTLTPPQSFYDLGIRCLPQWYSFYYNPSGRTPQYQMKWLQQNGGTDFNFKDPNAPKSSYRGLPLSYVHGTLEATGMENSDLAQELADVQAAKAFGYTLGISYYTLEAGPASDMDLLAKYRGSLYLG